MMSMVQDCASPQMAYHLVTQGMQGFAKKEHMAQQGFPFILPEPTSLQLAPKCTNNVSRKGRSSLCIAEGGAVDVVELGGALRWLGYPVTVERAHHRCCTAQELMYDVDVDRSGEIDFDEFLKIMRSGATHGIRSS
eukprot:6127809-Amphidinium_carterae.1